MTTTDQKYSCQDCPRDDLTLTRNGRVRSHAPNGKRVGPDNPACGGGSAFPVQDTEHHTHRFEWHDDENGHCGSYCTEDGCGMVEPENEPDLSDDPSLHVPPNPSRDPLPGGLHDQLPKSLGMGNGPADLAERSTRPAGPVGADDFLDGSDDDYSEPADDGGPAYWPARYDGECTTCFCHFDAGEPIRRLSDGSYEAKNCCGQDSEPQPDRPKSVARTLPVVRGMYSVPDPETGKRKKARRSSKFAEGIADSYMLDKWRHRMILAGLVKDPEILDKVASAMRDKDPLDVVKEKRDFLNDMADKAMSAAGGDERSSAGTKSHKFTEEVDAGTRALADVPDDFRTDAAAYVHALNNCGFRPVKGLIERSVWSRELGVAGTFDRVLECVRTTDVLDLDGRATTIHEGEFVIGDVKTGDNLEHPWLEILIQSAIYAHAVNENGVAVQDEPGGPFRWVALSELGAGPVREDVGVIMHVPYGKGVCKFYATDLITGWRGAKICKDNHDFWKIKLPKVPIAEYSVDPPEETGYSDEPGESYVEAATQNREDDQEAQELARAEGEYRLGTGAAAMDERPEDDVHAHLGKVSDQEWAESIRKEKEEQEQGDRARASMAKAREEYRKRPEYWEQRFTEARTREEANLAWEDAKRFGLPKDRIKELIALVKFGDPKPQNGAVRPPEPASDEPVAETGGSRQAPAQRRDGPTLTERAHRVTTKEEASRLFHEMTAEIKKLPEEKQPAARKYRDGLVAIMRQRLATPV